MRSSSPKKRAPAATTALRLLHSGPFWVTLACLPGVILFLNRFLIPDLSSDTVTYHLLNGARGLHNPLVPFAPSEFFPVGIMSINPIYDAVNFVLRELLGYRLGTILSLAALCGIVVVLYKLLRLILDEQHKKFNAWWGLLLVNAGIVLELGFQVATYYVDILNALLVLLVFYWILRLALRKTTQPPGLLQWSLVSLVLGGLIMLKLTNIGLVIPLFGLLAWELYAKRRVLTPKRWAQYIACAALCLLPVALAWAPDYAMTHNPIFPFYNASFRSPDYANVNFTDHFGGPNLWERLVWPLASVRHQIQLAEPHHIYNDYKFVAYWLCGILLLGLVAAKKIRLGRVQGIVLFYFLASLVFWGLLSGIGRYAVSSTALGGLVVAMLFAGDYRQLGKGVRSGMLLAGAGLCVLLVVEDWRTMHFNLNYDMSWRPTLGKNVQLHKAQVHSLFQKRLSVTPTQGRTIAQADILLNCHVNVGGWFTALPGAGGKPIVNIIEDQLPFYAGLSNSPAYRKEVAARLRTSLPAKKTYTWVAVASDDVGPSRQSCYAAVQARGGTVTGDQSLQSIFGFTGSHLTLLSGTIPL
ncbi:MAG TPA: hypothetical protein VLF71_00855 [Candidatus Saccharimonadales bacterium]|nr:hypothetical protein [Candidatus Saccharimonadales bacterium]